MQNAVIYARYSSHGQNEQTIEGQIRVCREYAEKSNLNIVNIYIDKHKTGTDVNRPQFQKMIKDSATGAFNYVIVYMIDRFARNRYYSTMYNFQLMQNDVKLISATENISESEEGEFYQMFLEWNAEKYSKRLSKRVRVGLDTSVENGTFTGGYLIYGYAKENNRVIINKEEADVVRYIYNRYAMGASKKEIAEELNKKGLRFNNKPYVAKNLDRLLTNSKYTGTYYFGNRLCDKTYPAIIDKITFETVQKRLSQNKYFSGANSAKIKYLLQGKIYCGLCGASMVAYGGTSRVGTKYHYYACNNKTKKHTCAKKIEQKDFLEWYVVGQTVNYLKDPLRISIIADDVIAYYEARIDNAELKRVTAEKIKVQKEIDNAVNAMISTSNTATHKILDKKIAELSTLLDDLSLHQSKLELERGLKITKNDIIAFINEFTEGNLHDKNFQKRIIDNLVNAFYIYDDKVVLYFNIKSGKETAFIGKDETDEALAEASVSVQTLTHSLRQVWYR